jgi:hypothetical protein
VNEQVAKAVEISRSKVIEFGPGAVQQLAKLVKEVMEKIDWRELPVAVKIELGNSIALLNKVVKTGEG